MSSLDAPTSAVIKHLVDCGWESSDFEINQLAYAAAVYLEKRDRSLDERFSNYWRTAGRLSALLTKASINHVIIKTRRHYPYFDTNVDVFIEDGTWGRVRDVLVGDLWRMPAALIRWKQRAIERAKIKLFPRTDNLVPAHVYYAVSWRYQRDVTFLDLDMVEEIPLVSEAPILRSEYGGQVIRVPSRAADILLHAAEIAFENYRIKLGEALYLQWLLDHVSSLERRRIYRLGIERGATNAFRCVLGQVRGEDVRDHPVGPGEWPQDLPAGDLLRAWWERLALQSKEKRLVSGVEEFLGYGSWAAMYRAKRAVLG